MKVATVKRKYKDSWVLVEVLETDDMGKMQDVKPIFADKDKETVYKKLSEVSKDIHTAVIYTGQVKGVFTI